MYCLNCSTELVAAANFCHQCGQSVNDVEVADSSSAVAGSGVNPGEDAPEREIWSGGFSPKAMVVSFAVLGVVSVALVVTAIAAAVKAVTWLWVVALLTIPILWLGQFIRMVQRLMRARYRLTDRRLFRQLGLIQHHKDQLDLARVESVRILQNVLQRLLDVGSIEIQSSDRRLRRVVMEGIDRADALAETIREVVRMRKADQVQAA